MFSLALLFGVFSVALGQSVPFYGPCRNVSTVKVDPSVWDSEMFVNVHRYGEEYSCGFIWNTPESTQNGDVLYNTWSRISNGVETIHTLHASFVREGVYEFDRTMDDGTTAKFLVNFLNYEPNNLLIINVCSDAPQFANGKDQVYVETNDAVAPARDACKIKKILEDNQISATELGLVNNCGCESIRYDPKCEGYTAPSVEDLFSSC